MDEPRVGLGFDVHAFAPERPLRLGGVIFEGEDGLAGHSDGDVVCHALADALFGAAGLGDVGEHFPDTDAAFAGIAGLDLLGRAVAEVRAAGFAPSSADLTVVAERPAIAPARDRDARSSRRRARRRRGPRLGEGDPAGGTRPDGRGGRVPRARGPGARVTETVAGRRAVLEAVRAGLAREVVIADAARSTPGLVDVLAAAEDSGVPVREVSRPELDALAERHQGIVAHVGAPEPVGERELATRPYDDEALVVVLDGIEDPQNLGAAARSAEAAGASMLVTRTRRAADVTPAAVRASAGALLHLPHARVANIPRALARLKEAGFTVVGLDERAERGVFDGPCPSGRIAIVLGSEGAGMSRLSREACDVLVSLPMRGRLGSLNASASLAAVLYAFVLPSRSGDRA